MGFAEKIGLKKSEKPLPPSQATYRNLNEAIVRRLSLILRAGEFKADGGIDLAEVVLDSGEVLNTMKGMGFITIGYAVEKLPHDPLRFLSWLRPAGLFDEEQKRKASRIVEIAKQAIYHEISTPCDLTSAHKALVLVAGPSHELSMKGYMTVRKWIDRSIAGLETRSGDYPVMNTKNVAIIVMLSGLENIPRITELKEIRSQLKPKKPVETEGIPEELTEKDQKNIRDDMITLPARRSRADDTGRKTPARDEPVRDDTYIPIREPVPQNIITAEAEEQTPVSFEAPRQILPFSDGPVVEPVSGGVEISLHDAQIPPRRRIVVTHAEKEHLSKPSQRTLSASGSQHTGYKPVLSDHTPLEPRVRHPGEEIPRSKETDRQRIEKELRRQRTMAMGGRPQKTPPHAEKSHQAIQETRIVQQSSHQDRRSIENQTPVQAGKLGELSGEKRTIIIGKRKVTALPHEDQDPSANQEKSNSRHRQEIPAVTYPADSPSLSDDDGMNVEIRDRIFRAKDEVFEGKGIRKPPVPQARDSTLLHTELRPKKKMPDKQDADKGTARADQTESDQASTKKRTKSEGKDQDLSWI